MQTDGERLKILRKTLNIKQGDFAEKISTTQGHISDIENGRKNLSERTIKLICLENWEGKNVNEEWLRSGVGDMFIKVPVEDETAALVYGLLGPGRESFYNMVLEIIKAYKQLSPNSQKVINELVENVFSNIKEKSKD
ncbi:MAG: helix-turn-helix transcriptional regulator [Hungatella hathewayi]|nr:helix-turn-helix transcriptional regulator [Hungatella hathewayi]